MRLFVSSLLAVLAVLDELSLFSGRGTSGGRFGCSLGKGRTGNESEAGSEKGDEGAFHMESVW
jgi:hypothetical protein